MMRRLLLALPLLLGGCAADVQRQAEDFRQRVHDASAKDLYKAHELAVYNHDVMTANCWQVLADFVAYYGKGGPGELTPGGAQAVQIFLDTQNPTGVIRAACDPVKSRLVTIARNAIASYGISLIP